MSEKKTPEECTLERNLCFCGEPAGAGSNLCQKHTPPLPSQKLYAEWKERGSVDPASMIGAGLGSTVVSAELDPNEQADKALETWRSDVRPPQRPPQVRALEAAVAMKEELDELRALVATQKKTIQGLTAVIELSAKLLPSDEEATNEGAGFYLLGEETAQNWRVNLQSTISILEGWSLGGLDRLTRDQLLHVIEDALTKIRTVRDGLPTEEKEGGTNGKP